jgi:hypothetical protein
LQHNNDPGADHVSYILGTLQSGIDSFFVVAHSCRCSSGLEESWKPEDWLPLGFEQAKTDFVKTFDEMIDVNTTPVQKVADLLRAIRIQLAFLAWYFPLG